MRVQLKPQRKKPDRTSVFINGKYAFSAPAETLVNFNLFKEKDISQQELEELIYGIEKKKAKDYAFRLLSYRMRSRKEILDRLRKRNIADAVISDVMIELEILGLIDDKKFAEVFARDRLNFGQKGKRLIFAELLKRGIDNSNTKSALNEILESQEAEICNKLINKFKQRYRNLPAIEQRQKLYTLLSRRGFSYNTIKQALKIEEE